MVRQAHQPWFGKLTNRTVSVTEPAEVTEATEVPK